MLQLRISEQLDNPDSQCRFEWIRNYPLHTNYFTKYQINALRQYITLPPPSKDNNLRRKWTHLTTDKYSTLIHSSTYRNRFV